MSGANNKHFDILKIDWSFYLNRRMIDRYLILQDTVYKQTLGGLFCKPTGVRFFRFCKHFDSLHR